MNTIAEVRMWGRTIGAVALAENEELASFQYADNFSKSGIGVSPLMMPLSTRVYQFPSLARSSFHGLPGLLADSLPDRYGNALIDAWLARQGRDGSSFDVIERLCYTGNRGMGALEYRPVTNPFPTESERIHVDELVDLASAVLQNREDLAGHVDEKESALSQLLRVGTSAGGARAKAVIAYNRETGELRSGQVKAGTGFDYWLLKFDGVSGNQDKELEDPLGYTAIEYAYYLMASEAGIEMAECQLLEEGGRRHFMTRRFDRTSNGKKLHMQSLAALRHFDLNAAGAHSYEQALQTIRSLDLPMSDVEEQFRRMVFNIVARNQDDHVKNIAFLMDKKGRWSLSPAFDVTFSYNPAGMWTSQHQMTMNGKRDDFTRADFKAVEELMSMKRGRGAEIVEEVIDVISCWRQFASEAEVAPEWVEVIEQHHRLKFLNK